MSRRCWVRRRALVGLVTMGLVVAGCTPDEPRQPEPSAQAGYVQPPEDLCERVRFDDVLRRWELSQPPEYEPGRDYDTGEASWYVRCNFSGVAEDGRFTTEFGDFGATGVVRLRVYYDEARAVDRYEPEARGLVDRPALYSPGGTTTEVTGWWDDGISLELGEELDPDNYVLGDFEITRLEAWRLVRHHNLVADVSAVALAPTELAGEATALLGELIAALLDEAAGHLTRTE